MLDRGHHRSGLRGLPRGPRRPRGGIGRGREDADPALLRLRSGAGAGTEVRGPGLTGAPGRVTQLARDRLEAPRARA